MVKRLLTLAAVLLVLLPSVSTTQAAMPARKHRPVVVVRGHRVVVVRRMRGIPANGLAGQLTNMNGSVLTVASQGMTYTVNVSSTTKIVRLYNGLSALDEMSLNDYLVVKGTTVTTGTINATWIKDQSIQRAWTRVAATLKSVVGTTAPATATVTVVRDRLNAPFSLGQTITMNVGASTAVISPTATGTVVLTGTAALPTLAAATGKTLTVLGTYDRVHLSFTTVYRVFIHRK